MAVISLYLNVRTANIGGNTKMEDNFCEATLPTTGQRCRLPAAIVITRFGEAFRLCAICALREQREHRFPPAKN